MFVAAAMEGYGETATISRSTYTHSILGILINHIGLFKNGVASLVTPLTY